MPTHDTIAAARREAKLRSRTGGVTHQQALDAVAREAGHEHWSAMATAHAAPPAAHDDVRAFVDAYRHDGRRIDHDTHALLEDAIHGYLADAPRNVAEFVDNYEFRGDGFDHVPNEAQRTVMTEAIRRYAESKSPRTVETMPTVAAAASSTAPRRRRPGLDLETLFWSMKSESVRRGIRYAERGRKLRHAIRSPDLTPSVIAGVLEPDRAFQGDGTQMVRCPLHDDANPSLRLSAFRGAIGNGIAMTCMSGCDANEIEDAIVVRVRTMRTLADAFMAANDESRVASGASRGPEGVGGMGGRYTLVDGRHFDLPVAACRIMGEAYPLWAHDDHATPAHDLELAVRSVVRGHHEVKLKGPDEKGAWTLDVVGYAPRENHAGYVVNARWPHEGAFGLRGSWTDVDRTDQWDEVHTDRQALVERIEDLLASPQTTDPVEIAAGKARIEREQAIMAAMKGTVDGWGWWVGPNEDEFNWGGPYKLKADAIGEGNGSCTEDGETYFVIQARTDPTEEDREDGFVEFLETRDLTMIKSQD